jgi:uncharacterized protein DUF1579
MSLPNFRLISACMAIVIMNILPASAQSGKDSAVKEVDFFTQMIDYSRPGKYHAMLAELVGTWTFKGRHFDWVDSVTNKISLEFGGTIVRKSFADGRWFIVNVTSDSTLEIPIQNGKMRKGKFQGLELEGYDNVKQRFVRTVIGNHLSSGLFVPEGVYDSTSNVITFDSESELVPGVKSKDHLLYLFFDKDHYKWEAYMDQNGKYRLASEINFTRVKGK